MNLFVSTEASPIPKLLPWIAAVDEDMIPIGPHYVIIPIASLRSQ